MALPNANIILNVHREEIEILKLTHGKTAYSHKTDEMNRCLASEDTVTPATTLPRLLCRSAIRLELLIHSPPGWREAATRFSARALEFHNIFHTVPKEIRGINQKD